MFPSLSWHTPSIVFFWAAAASPWPLAPGQQVTEKHYTAIQIEETTQSLELSKVLMEDELTGSCGEQNTRISGWKKDSLKILQDINVWCLSNRFNLCCCFMVFRIGLGIETSLWCSRQASLVGFFGSNLTSDSGSQRFSAEPFRIWVCPKLHMPKNFTLRYHWNWFPGKKTNRYYLPILW